MGKEEKQKEVSGEDETGKEQKRKRIKKVK
jgi:hypothetical protein